MAPGECYENSALREHGVEKIDIDEQSQVFMEKVSLEPDTEKAVRMCQDEAVKGAPDRELVCIEAQRGEWAGKSSVKG